MSAIEITSEETLKDLHKLREALPSLGNTVEGGNRRYNQLDEKVMPLLHKLNLAVCKGLKSFDIQFIDNR